MNRIVHLRLCAKKLVGCQVPFEVIQVYYRMLVRMRIIDISPAAPRRRRSPKTRVTEDGV
jgi:hypothetical protein